MNIRILLDLDGVACNFLKAYFEKYGERLDETERNIRHDRWNQLVDEGMFATLDCMPDWLTLKDELFNLLATGAVHTLEICTSAGGVERYEDVKQQKETWLKTHGMGEFKAHVVKYGSLKAKVIDDTQYRDILIDDTQRVIDHFVDAGGEAILHTSAASTISQLHQLIQKDDE